MSETKHKGQTEYTKIKRLLALLDEQKTNGRLSGNHRKNLRALGIDPDTFSVQAVENYLGYPLSLMEQMTKYTLNMTQNKKGTQHHDEEIVLKSDPGTIPHGRVSRGLLQKLSNLGRHTR